eukprot:COSAG06_NODE_22425_length_723_cov_6.016026_1_plen_113_part_00
MIRGKFFFGLRLIWTYSHLEHVFAKMEMEMEGRAFVQQGDHPDQQHQLREEALPGAPTHLPPPRPRGKTGTNHVDGDDAANTPAFRDCSGECVTPGNLRLLLIQLLRFTQKR